jgi:RimJ/RimL family protein N-acetyltransferase
MLIRLEPLAADHLPHVMTWVNDREVMQYFANHQTDLTEDEERYYLAKLIQSPLDRAWSIFFGQDYVGQCSINQIYWPARNGRIFIAIGRRHQGRGAGTAALTQLIELAWKELDLHKLWLIVRRDNKGAQAMYVKLGFDFEGVLADEYCVNGRYFDMVRMGLVRRSWHADTGQPAVAPVPPPASPVPP